MDKLLPKIEEVLKQKKPNRHSFFQLYYFVIGKEPTIQAKIQSCVQELSSKKNDIDNILLELEDQYDQRRLLELDLEEQNEATKPGEGRSKERHEIRLKQMKRKKRAMEKRIQELHELLKGREEEASFLIQTYGKLIEVEEAKDWDSTEVQTEYWNARLTNELHCELALGHPPHAETYKCIMALPGEVPVRKEVDKIIEQRRIAMQKAIKEGDKENK